MIAMLSGTVAEKLSELIVLDVRGVGYGLLVPHEDHGKLSVGDSAKLYVFEHIRENAHDLYGFRLPEIKALFEQLLGVNGVGPKMALNVLGIGNSNHVRRAIASGDVKFIQQASGVGKRVAERIVVELKDKVGLIVGTDADNVLLSDTMLDKDEAVQALLALGYSHQDAAMALAGIDQKLSTEARVKQALKGSSL